MDNVFGSLLATLGIIALVCVTVAVIGLSLLVRSIRRLNIPRDADFFTTMRMIPITLVVLLDMLDFGLDIFATPLVWLFLDRMGLNGLRNKAVIEALIPFSGPIPTFTIAWIAARTLNLGEAELEAARRLAGQTPSKIIDVDGRSVSGYNKPKKDYR